jgi:hypothetical protein
MKAIILFGILISSASLAAVGENVKVIGKVGNISKSAVTLETELGPVQVPRYLFEGIDGAKKIPLLPGKTTTVEMPLADLVLINSKPSGKH